MQWMLQSEEQMKKKRQGGVCVRMGRCPPPVLNRAQRAVRLLARGPSVTLTGGLEKGWQAADATSLEAEGIIGGGGAGKKLHECR